jgi:uncharacterized membrane protein YfcA
MLLSSIQTVLFIFIVVMLFLAVYNSFRYRREQDVKKRGLYAARMNMFMGIMLVGVAITQLFFFTDTAFRRIFGSVCLLLGLFNFFAGVRNYSYFSRMKS